MLPPFRDLGLSYEQAAHAIQTAKALDLESLSREDTKKFEPKFMRTGIDTLFSEASGLARLLMDRGLFTLEEYIEYMRLSLNEEVAREQDRLGVRLG